MKNQDTIPFPDELEHLNQTLEIIDTALTKAREDVLRLDKEYRDAKRYMADYRNEMDSHEKLQNEQLLDQTDRTGVFAVEVREKMEKLKESPYFARVDFVSDGEETADTFYIGRFGFTHDNEKLIFDWRAPISGIFYDDVGRAGFEALVGWIEGELTRKRQFKIQNGVNEDEAWANRAKFKSNLAFVGLLDKYICNISERVFLAKDYTYQGYVVQASWITPFSVKVIIDDLNYRSEPSINGAVKGQTGKGVFTIVEVNDGWGRLKSGAGWIWLSNPTYCTVGKTVKTTENSKKSIDELAKECCGKPTVLIEGKKTKRFCSSSCRNKWWNSNLDKVNKKANYEFTCVRCHKTFTAYGNKRRKYCCHECYVADRYYGGI